MSELINSQVAIWIEKLSSKKSEKIRQGDIKVGVCRKWQMSWQTREQVLWMRKQVIIEREGILLRIQV